ncbi:MAG: hypothetical protein RBS08_09560 [Bdellovibrionales bacterium]|jgi:hypothetical protein|nr:hypothetical protein [Bdellovibrionales bacterium]
MRNKASFEKASRDNRFDFEAAVEAAYLQNPGLESSVYFVDIGSGRVAHPDPAILSDLLHFISDSPAGQQHIQPKIRDCQNHKTSYCHFGGESSFVYIYTGDDRPSFFSSRVSEAQEMHFIFDHEFAHAHIPSGASDNRFLAENTADAYALIRHIQRFGNKTPLTDEIVGFRARDTVFRANGIFNFSCPAMEHILDMRKTVDFAALTPAQTSGLAEQIALEYTPDGDMLKRLYTSFSPLQKNSTLQELEQLAVTTKDAEVLKWSATVLKAVLKNKIAAPEGTTAEGFGKDMNKRLAAITRRQHRMTPQP